MHLSQQQVSKPYGQWFIVYICKTDRQYLQLEIVENSQFRRSLNAAHAQLLHVPVDAELPGNGP
jgi:hypothetical protein